MSRLARLRTLSLLALGWTGLGWLGGDILSGGPGEAGTHAAARSAEIAALVRAAEGPPGAAGAQETIAAAETAARQALRDSPLDTSALALLGLAAAVRDEPERAEQLMQLAAGRAPADLMARGWLFDRRLKAGDVAGALAHADAMLRARPDLLDELLPALAAIAADAEALPGLAGLLGGEPPWRGRFLELLARETADPLAPYGLYAALMAESVPPLPTELRPYLARLIEAGLYEQARLLWTQALPAERLAEVGYLANGGFEEEPAGYLFDWSLEPVVGARAEIATIPGSDGNRALRIQFLDRKVAFRHVRQLLMLMPGRYRLTGRVKAEGLENPRGLTWTLTCADQPEIQLGASERVSGTTRWQGFEAVFEVPASGCVAQWLRLELAARIAAESHAAGAAWYDELAVSRLDEVEDSCPDDGPMDELPSEALGGPQIGEGSEPKRTAAAAAASDDAEEDVAQCTCSAPAGTPAELVEVEGDVIVFREEKGFLAGRRVPLVAGDRVMVRAGGRAVLVQAMCRFELKPQSVVTLREEACTLCATVVTAGEANVAYGQGAGEGAAVVSGGEANVAYGQGAGGSGGAFIGSPTLTPVASPSFSLPSGIVLGLPPGEARPPASQ